MSDAVQELRGHYQSALQDYLLSGAGEEISTLDSLRL